MKSATERRAYGDNQVDSPMFEGLQSYRNFVRPHSSLEVHTPAERAEVGLAKNKWLAMLTEAITQHDLIAKSRLTSHRRDWFVERVLAKMPCVWSSLRCEIAEQEARGQ